MAVKVQDPFGDTSPTNPNPGGGQSGSGGGADTGGPAGGGGGGADPGVPPVDVTVPPLELPPEQGGGGGPQAPLPGVPGEPAPPPLPAVVAPPNTPTSLGTFALPGTAGSEAFRSPNFAMNRGLGKDIAGAIGKRKRFSEGVPVAAQTGQLTASARRPEDWADSIAAYLAGR